MWKRQHEHPLWSVINPGPPSGLWVSERTLIYRAGKTVRHVNLQNGAIVWETRLSDERGTNLLGAGKVLLVGSHAGYLHALDRESGHRLWSRDLWTSLKPGSFHVTVLGVYKEAVLLKIGKYVAMLIPNGQTSWPIPPPTPAHVPEPEAFE
ncbi:MAG: PQQ-binding-like beta-propeller repeat protein [Anaerolineae bacterium]|nr:PQQ-binding-like beta-propeller repeat protein [Anaerolineae bacterium]